MSSGALTTKMHAFTSANENQDVQLLNGRNKIVSFKVSNNQAAAMTVDFYDGTSNSGKLIHRVHIGALKTNLDFDMHGCVISDGLYILVSGAGTKINVSVSAQYN
tara:strand:- start:845 stop:1159 length:315 start_codon:yes stop_codon:yes gene_type:complete